MKYWGNPEDAQDRWGNYLNVKKRLMRFAKPDLVLLEIGSLAGKWTQHLLEAKEIICVDINELGFDYIKQKLPITNVSFYLSEGDELRGVDDESVDVVFSMDTFVRVSKKCIESYFKESARVCKSGGRIFFHLGSVDNDVCIRKNFILFSDEEIDDLCDSNGFSSLEVDRETLIHGVILEAVKGGD